ncbi:hypothetical protein ABLE71_10690, partial [Mesorhizobium sp. KR9-304]
MPVDAGSGTPVQLDAAGAVRPSGEPTEYVADAGNLVRLPANASIDNIRVEGDNLVLEQADGTLIVIKDAAANVPTFVIGEVEVPRVALLAALEGSGIDVAFGADGSINASPGDNQPNSSGGNFEQPPGGIGDGFDLSALLPPTALAFPQYEGKELYPSLEEENVAGEVLDGTASLTVAEEGLNDDGSDLPGGSTDETDATGTLQFKAGSDALTVQFAALAGQPQPGAGFDPTEFGLPVGTQLVWAYGSSGTDKTVLIGSLGGVDKIQLSLGGTLAIAAGATGNVTVTATLLDETPHDFTGTTAKNSFTISGVDVEAVDSDSAALTATVDVSVTDDIPTLVINDPDATADDATTVSEGGGAAGTVNGTWTHESGADDPATVEIKIDDGAYATVAYGVGQTVVGAGGETLGTLTIDNDGEWHFVSAANIDQDLDTDFSFTLKVTDSEGDFVEDSFTVNVTDVAGEVLDGTASLTVAEEGLNDDGSDLPGGSTDETDATGTLQF